MADKNTIRNWFRTGLRPSQAQFWASWDSFWHKDEMIPVSKINNLQNVLNVKADQEALQNHLDNPNAHADLFSQIKTTGRFLINRNNVMMFANEPLLGDIVTGMVEGEYLNAGTFYGGNFELLSSYINSVGNVVSFDNNGLLLINLNSEVVNRYYESGELSCLVKITTLDGNVFEHGVYPVEMELNNPISVYIQGKYDYGSTILISDLLDEFVESSPFVYSLVEPEEAQILEVTHIQHSYLGGQDLFYNNILKNEFGQPESVIQYVDKDYNYLGEINQGPLPSPTNVVRFAQTGQKIAEFKILNANFFQTAFDGNLVQDFQFVLQPQTLNDVLTLQARVVPVGNTSGFWNNYEESNVRTVEYSNDGVYRETDFQSNIFGDWESLVRIKTKINTIN